MGQRRNLNSAASEVRIPFVLPPSPRNDLNGTRKVYSRVAQINETDTAMRGPMSASGSCAQPGGDSPSAEAAEVVGWVSDFSETRTHWKMSRTISSFTDDEVLALEPRLTPKEGRAMEERRRMVARPQVPFWCAA